MLENMSWTNYLFMFSVQVLILYFFVYTLLSYYLKSKRDLELEKIMITLTMSDDMKQEIANKLFTNIKEKKNV